MRKAAHYKSKLEEAVAALLPNVDYEPDRLEYHVIHKYNPDFKIGPNTYIEAKGLWVAADRAKHLHIKEQHPEVKVYFVFQNPNLKLNRASKTTYGQWATDHGFEWTTIEMGIPKEWFHHAN